MRRLDEFKVVLVSDDGETYTVTGERDTITTMDTTFGRVFIPVKVAWENSPHIEELHLISEPASNPPTERPMGGETLIHGHRDYSDPNSDKFGSLEFDFREYPDNVFDLFEMQLSDNVWHLDNYTNLETQVRHRI